MDIHANAKSEAQTTEGLVSMRDHKTFDRLLVENARVRPLVLSAPSFIKYKTPETIEKDDLDPVAEVELLIFKVAKWLANCELPYLPIMDYRTSEIDCQHQDFLSQASEYQASALSSWETANESASDLEYASSSYTTAEESSNNLRPPLGSLHVFQAASEIWAYPHSQSRSIKGFSEPEMVLVNPHSKCLPRRPQSQIIDLAGSRSGIFSPMTFGGSARSWTHPSSGSFSRKNCCGLTNGWANLPSVLSFINPSDKSTDFPVDDHFTHRAGNSENRQKKLEDYKTIEEAQQKLLEEFELWKTRRIRPDRG